ncbi:hypothetical protein CEXT_220961 [Caerostris extrusa]|uniref:Uncharacterized protein n=1 Tax=Caerostris extrusa TaxID=172846 RepID=A0AAV4N530_CAEEX|nr:hypothetical protein CEXT_220961 [Caerostris extrusa]
MEPFLFDILMDDRIFGYRVPSKGPTYLFPFPIPGCGLLSRVSQNRNCDEIELHGMGGKSKIREIAKCLGEVEMLSFENSSRQISKGNGSELNREPTKKMTKKYPFLCSNLFRINVSRGAKNNGEEERISRIPYSAFSILAASCGLLSRVSQNRDRDEVAFHEWEGNQRSERLQSNWEKSKRRHSKTRALKSRKEMAAAIVKSFTKPEPRRSCVPRNGREIKDARDCKVSRRSRNAVIRKLEHANLERKWLRSIVKSFTKPELRRTCVPRIGREIKDPRDCKVSGRSRNAVIRKLEHANLERKWF